MCMHVLKYLKTFLHPLFMTKMAIPQPSSVTGCICDGSRECLQVSHFGEEDGCSQALQFVELVGQHGGSWQGITDHRQIALFVNDMNISLRKGALFQ